MKKYLVSICLAESKLTHPVDADGYRILENGNVYFFRGDIKDQDVVLTVASGRWLYIEDITNA